MFVIDLLHVTSGCEVDVVGFVVKKYKDKFFLHIKVSDITGSISAVLNKNSSFPVQIRQGDRVKIKGCLVKNDNAIFQINPVINITVLGSSSANLLDLNDELHEQSSRMLLGRICRRASCYLSNRGFNEISSRIISRHWTDGGLEPLRVLYPGFGAAVTLATSPASQVLDFLIVTMLPRAFTSSYSFSTTYRFPNGSADMPIIVARGVDLSLVTLRKLIWGISHYMLKCFQHKEVVDSCRCELPIVNAYWPPDIENNFSKNLFLNFIEYSANIHIETENWTSCINTIIHIFDRNDVLLAEGSMEKVGPDLILSTITLYPSQFLSVVGKAPLRQLKNLGVLHSWDKK